MSTPTASPASGDATATSIEAHGIDLISPTERRGTPRSLFGMWLGTNLNIFYVVNGAVVVSLGLPFAQALVAIAIGNLAFFAVGATSLQGPATGTSTFAVSRAPFGPRGGKGVALANWVTCVGFEASGLALVVLAVLALLGKAGVPDSAAVKSVVIVGATVVQGVLPLWGHAAIVGAQRRLAWLFGAAFVVMAILVAPKLHVGSMTAGGGWVPISLAIALVASGGGLSWANTGSDYSRYLPATSSRRAVFWWSSLGGLVPAVLLEVLGAAIASVTKDAADPISGIPGALPGAVAVPYLLVATLTLLAVNTVNLYSSGLTLQSLGLRLPRWQCVVLDSAVCAVLCFLVVFAGAFNTAYSEFLGLLIIWLAPWFAIYAVDAWLRRGSYDAAALLDVTPRGRYWRSGGFFVPGVVAQLLGMVASALWIDSAAFVGPLSSATGGSDLSVVTGLVVGAGAYWLLARAAVRREVAALAAVGADAGPHAPADQVNRSSRAGADVVGSA